MQHNVILKATFQQISKARLFSLAFAFFDNLNHCFTAMRR